MVNIELLDEVLAYIETHPEEWDQTIWGVGNGSNASQDENGEWRPGPACGTTFCLAGHIAARKAKKLIWDREDSFSELSLRSVINNDGSRVAVGEFARIELGISEWDAGRLFDAGNSIESLRWKRDILANGGSIPYSYF